MKKIIGIVGGLALAVILMSIKFKDNTDPVYYSIAQLRELYGSGDPLTWPSALVDSAVVNYQDIGSLKPPVHPNENPFSEAKRELGKNLFFDPRLSSSQQISCASCHDPALAWGDGKPVSHGHDRQTGTRNAKSLLNVAYANPLFWDGRALSLEDQARFPILDQKEMANHVDVAVKSIKKIKGYKKLFHEAFGDDKITEDRIFKAIATFERTIVSRKSRFDKFIEGDNKQLTDQEVQGLHLFRTKAKCINCHNSTYFSDNQFHNVGLTYYKRKYEDLGLYTQTKKNEDVGKFKTPSLRDVKYTAPYMHNGLFPTLRGVLNMYNAGMPNRKLPEGFEKDPTYPKNSNLLHVLELNEEELQALEAFLGAISSPIFREPAPEKLPI